MNTDTDLAGTLDFAAGQAMALVEAWRRSGEENFCGQGDAFMFQVAHSMFATLVGQRYIGRNKPEAREALLGKVKDSDRAFAALDIPEDEIMMYGIGLALIMVYAQQARQRGWPQGEFGSIDNILREAAKLTGVLSGGAPSDYVNSIGAMTDAELKDAAQKASLFRTEAVGNA